MNGKAVTALIVALLAGGGIAIALSGGDDDEKLETVVVTEEPATTTPAATETTAAPEKSDEEQIEEVVNQYIAQSSESETVECDLVVDDVCVQNESDIDLSSVEEFSGDLAVDGVQVNGDQAQAQLNRGGSFELRKEEGSWKISGFEPPARPDRGGGVEAPKRPEVDRSGGAQAP